MDEALAALVDLLNAVEDSDAHLLSEDLMDAARKARAVVDALAATPTEAP